NRDIAPLNTQTSNRINQAVETDNANGPCIKIGNMSSEANMAIMIIKNIKIACLYIGYLNTLKFITVSSNLNCLIENKTIPITPMMMVRYTLGLKKPSLLSPAELKP